MSYILNNYQAVNISKYNIKKILFDMAGNLCTLDVDILDDSDELVMSKQYTFNIRDSFGVLYIPENWDSESDPTMDQLYSYLKKYLYMRLQESPYWLPGGTIE